MTNHRTRTGFSLLELLIVISIIGIMAGAMIPSSRPSIHDQLQMTAKIIVADINYARALAVTNNSKYKLTFDYTNNKYILTHSGTNTVLNTLPPSPFKPATDPSDQQIVLMSSLPRVGPPANLFAGYAVVSPAQSINELEIGPLGETTRAEESLFWLSAGNGSETRYLSIRVNPVTSLTWVENFTATTPTAPSVVSGS